MHDVVILREVVPGCQELEETAPGIYSGAATVGIAVIKGLYKGNIRMIEEKAPSFLRLAVEARSGHAEIKGEGTLHLDAEDGGTRWTYDGDARLAGPLAGIGQRLLPSATKSLTEQLFRNLEARLQRDSETSNV
jgi:carbon monoxide dehydrogenase subunit G